MKTIKLSMLATIMLLVVAIQCHAQPAPGQGAAKLPPPRPEKERLELQQVNSYKGQVGELTTNDDYIYDGFYLQTADSKYRVKFPAHLGSQLTKALKTGSSVTVKGVEHLSPENEKEIRFFNVMVNGQTISDNVPASPPTAQGEEQVTGSGKITSLQKNRDAEVNGYILDDKTILRVPPHVIGQLNNMVSKGATISYTGTKKNGSTGEVHSGQYSVVHCQSVTVNGTQYLTL